MATIPIPTQTTIQVTVECKNLSDHIFGFRDEVLTYLRPKAPGAKVRALRKDRLLEIEGAAMDAIRHALEQATRKYLAAHGVHMRTVVVPGKEPPLGPTAPAASIDGDTSWKRTTEQLQRQLEQERELWQAERTRLLEDAQAIIADRDAALAKIEELSRDQAETRPSMPERHDVESGPTQLARLEKLVVGLHPKGVEGFSQLDADLAAELVALTKEAARLAGATNGGSALVPGRATWQDLEEASHVLSVAPPDMTEAAYQQAKETLQFLRELQQGKRNLLPAVAEALRATASPDELQKFIQRYEAQARTRDSIEQFGRRLAAASAQRKRLEEVRTLARAEPVRIAVDLDNQGQERHLRVSSTVAADAPAIRDLVDAVIGAACRSQKLPWRTLQENGGAVGLKALLKPGPLPMTSRIAVETAENLRKCWKASPLGSIPVPVVVEIRTLIRA